MNEKDKLEILLNIEKSKVFINYIKYKDIIFSIFSVYIMGVFWAWCSSSDESNIMQVTICNLKFFYILLIIIPIILMVSFNYYKKLITEEFFNKKKWSLLSKKYWNKLLFLYIYEKLDLVFDKGKEMKELVKQINSIDKDTIKKLIITEYELENYLQKLYLKNDFLEINSDFYNYLSRYCIISGMEDEYILKNDNNYILNEPKAKGMLFNYIKWMKYYND